MGTSSNWNSKKKSWIKPLYTFFVIAIPAFMIWYFLSGDFISTNQTEIWIAILVAIAFILISSLVTIILIYFKILDIFVLNFSLPIAITFMIIFLSSFISGDYALKISLRAILSLLSCFLVIPINILITKYNIKLIAKDNVIKEK